MTDNNQKPKFYCDDPINRCEKQCSNCAFFEAERDAKETPQSQETGEVTEVFEIDTVYNEFLASWEFANLDNSFTFKWLKDRGYKFVKSVTEPAKPEVMLPERAGGQSGQYLDRDTDVKPAWVNSTSQPEEGKVYHGTYGHGEYYHGEITAQQEPSQESTEAEISELLHELEYDPYPEDIFPPLTENELKRLKDFILFQLCSSADRVSAHFGRILRKPLREKARAIYEKFKGMREEKGTT